MKTSILGLPRDYVCGFLFMVVQCRSQGNYTRGAPFCKPLSATLPSCSQFIEPKDPRKGKRA